MMNFDLTSMLLGAAASGIGLCLTMLSLWSTDCSSFFKLNWSVGVSFFIAHVFAYWYYDTSGSALAGVIACALQPIGAVFVYASVRRFFDRKSRPLLLVFRVSVPYLLVVPAIFAMGYDGIALIIQNALTGTLLCLGGVEYFRRWRDAPLSIGSLAALYSVTGISFLLCGLVILFTEQWSIGYPPQNWAEGLNTIISVLALSGAGALTLSVDQTILAKNSQLSAMIDPLSGLLNRRGFASVRSGRLYENDAILLFDLDNFKLINDRYGHATGDKAIRAFADTMRAYGRPADPRARLGGEEFAVLLSDISLQDARTIAERIISAFSEENIISDDGEYFRCTTSGGLAFGDEEGAPIEEVLIRADQALYSAKRAGRNRVESAKLRLVS